MKWNGMNEWNGMEWNGMDWMKEWIKELMNEWINELINEWMEQRNERENVHILRTRESPRPPVEWQSPFSILVSTWDTQVNFFRINLPSTSIYHSPAFSSEQVRKRKSHIH
jgi:hypothetical protein